MENISNVKYKIILLNYEKEKIQIYCIENVSESNKELLLKDSEIKKLQILLKLLKTK